MILGNVTNRALPLDLDLDRALDDSKCNLEVFLRDTLQNGMEFGTTDSDDERISPFQMNGVHFIFLSKYIN